MDQLFEFVGNHSFLTTLFVTLSIMLAYDIYSASISGIQSIDPAVATGLMSHDDAIVIDVRDKEDFKTGHIINSIHIPYADLEKKTASLEKHKQSKTIISCNSGNSSMIACRQLKKHGFENLFNLRGGIIAWKNDNLPLSKSK
jgi:rhodanese-related sulfurtransferase